MKTSYTKEEQRKYSMGYQAGYKKAVKDNGGADGLGNSLLRQRAHEVQTLKAHRLYLIGAVVGSWIGFLISL